MLHEEPTKKREQISLVCIDELVPQNHLLRKIDRVINWSFIYDLVKEKYSPDFGRPSIDPVILIKIVLIQYLYGIRSMRQTIREIEVNLAYRWFLGLDMYVGAAYIEADRPAAFRLEIARADLLRGFGGGVTVDIRQIDPVAVDGGEAARP